MLKITKRPITIHDFIKMKKREPYATFRTTAKMENFGLMFGAQVNTFAGLLQGSSFTTKDCDDYIKLTHAEDLLEETIAQAKKRGYRDYFGGEMRADVECKYTVAAALMREAFLNGYEGLKTRIEREHAFAIKHFYTRLWYGAVRWHPELAYMNINSVGKLEGADKKFYQRVFSHLMNNSSNSAVQSGETVFIYLGWVSADYYMNKWKLSSQIFNTIHDSLDAYAWKPEANLMPALINACVHNKIRYPCEGIYHRMDPEISDIRDYKHLTGYEMGEFDGTQKIKGHYYKHGEESEAMEIQEAVKEYNDRMATNIEFKEIPA